MAAEEVKPRLSRLWVWRDDSENVVPKLRGVPIYGPRIAFPYDPYEMISVAELLGGEDYPPEK